MNQDTKISDVNVFKFSDRLTVYLLESFSKTNSFSEDVRAGLTNARKYLLPKYFYDERGSMLFEKICNTKEYYPTRTETEILKNMSGEISERNKDKDLLVELGSGSSVKTNMILSSFLETRKSLNYTPIDVSKILIESSKKLTQRFENLYIKGIISFYEEGMDFFSSMDKSPKLILFLGSSIGNFSKYEAVNFLKMLSGNMNKEDRLIIGFDMLKDKEILESAYNDACGITAEFNLNLLHRINRELGGNFDAKKFRHEALFNEGKSRIEMYLVSQEKLSVNIDACYTVDFEKGEKIHTENSYKYSREMINELAEDSGLEFSDYYSDRKNFFSLCTFRLHQKL